MENISHLDIIQTSNRFEKCTLTNAEIYASLSASLLKYHYAKKFMIAIMNDCLAICGNLVFVNKLSWLLEDDYNSNGLHKSTEQEALKLILKIISESFRIEYIESHQDKPSPYVNASTKACLNVGADVITTLNATLPINTHILTNKFTIYVNKNTPIIV